MKKLFISLTLVAFLAGGLFNSYQAKAQSTEKKDQTVKVQEDKTTQKVTDPKAGTVTPATPTTTAPSASTIPAGTTTKTTTTTTAKPAGCPPECPMKAKCDPVKSGCPQHAPGCCKTKTPPKK
jgi:cytoskeletal protein RodZ